MELSIDEGVAMLWLNRPERLNAVAPGLVDDLLDALDRVAAREDVRAVVLAGRGRAFCAGHDMKEPRPEGDPRRRLERLQAVTERLRSLPQAVIAAVHGHAIGAGAEFTLGCDLVIGADDAVFRFPEAELGLSVTGATSRLLPLLVGPLKAKELLLFGERIEAPAALELGLVNTVVAQHELREHALRWAESIAARPSGATALAKRAVDRGLDSTVEVALELEVSHALITDGSGELAASTRAFRERG